MTGVRLQAALIAVLCALVVGASGGWLARTWYGASKTLVAQQRDAKAVAKENTRRRAVGAQHAADQRRIEDYYDALPDWWKRAVVERPAIADCELGPDGLRDWNRWNAGPGADRRGAAGQGADEPAAGAERPP